MVKWYFVKILKMVIEKKTYPVKDVFRTFKEINQMDLVKQAGVRQHIDQGVSLNLAFPSITSPKWINQVTLELGNKELKFILYENRISSSR